MDLATVEEQAVDSPIDWAKDHIEQYLQSDGKDVEHPMADSMILLYTKGRKSGKIRRIPIVAYRGEGELFVMASKGGAPTHPEWYLNLVDNPTVWVRDKDEFFEANATTVSSEERPEIFGMFTDRFPGFEEYEKKTERTIPIVRLTPRS